MGHDDDNNNDDDDNDDDDDDNDDGNDDDVIEAKANKSDPRARSKKDLKQQTIIFERANDGLIKSRLLYQFTDG